MLSPRLAAMVVFMTSSGCPSVVTSNMFKPAPTSRLENLTGGFSSLVLTSLATVDIAAIGGTGRVKGPDRGEMMASLPVGDEGDGNEKMERRVENGESLILTGAGLLGGENNVDRELAEVAALRSR